jgi:hypothetical protein
MIKASKVNPSVAPRRFIDATIPFKAIATIREHFSLVFEDESP